MKRMLLGSSIVGPIFVQLLLYTSFALLSYHVFIIFRTIADADENGDFRLFHRYDDKQTIHLIKAAAETLGSLQIMQIIAIVGKTFFSNKGKYSFRKRFVIETIDPISQKSQGDEGTGEAWEHVLYE